MGDQKTLVGAQSSVHVAKQYRDPTTSKASTQKNQKVGQEAAESHLQTKHSPTEADSEQDQGRQVELPGKVLLPCQALEGEQQAEREGHTLLQTALCSTKTPWGIPGAGSFYKGR